MASSIKTLFLTTGGPISYKEEEARERKGIENPCRQRPKKMWVSQEELHRQKVPLYYRYV